MGQKNENIFFCPIRTFLIIYYSEREKEKIPTGSDNPSGIFFRFYIISNSSCFAFSSDADACSIESPQMQK